MAIKKSPALVRAEVKLKKLHKEVKLTDKRIKQLSAKGEKAAKAEAKKLASKKSKPASKKTASKKSSKKVTAKKAAPKKSQKIKLLSKKRESLLQGGILSCASVKPRRSVPPAS